MSATRPKIKTNTNAQATSVDERSRVIPPQAALVAKALKSRQIRSPYPAKPPPRLYSYRQGLMISACGCLGVLIYAGVVLMRPPMEQEEFASDDLVREFIKDSDVTFQDDELRPVSLDEPRPAAEASGVISAQQLTLFPEQQMAQKAVSSLDRTLERLRSHSFDSKTVPASQPKAAVTISPKRASAADERPVTASLRGEGLGAVWTHKISFIAGLIAVHRPTLPRSGELSKDIVELSLRAGVDPFLTAAIISVESGFQPFARSNKGAQGLMQLLPGTARDVYESKTGREADPKLTDPRTNIVLGIAYIKQLDSQFKGNKKLALAAYNWGPGNISDAKNGKKRIPKSVIDYAKMVLDRAVRWRKQFDDATESASALAQDMR